MATQQPHTRTDAALLEGLQRHLQPLTGTAHDYEPLLQLIGPARFALLGEASHGTREFYRERAAITRRLIIEKASLRSRWKPTGPTPGASTATCVACPTMPTLRRR